MASENNRRSWEQSARGKPDTSATSLFIAVGQALTTWERLEEVLAVLFGALVSSRSGGAERAFGTIAGSSARGAMVSEAAEVVLKNAPKLRDEIKGVVTQMGRLSARRNEIAHGIVASFENYGWYLVPALYNSRKNDAFFSIKSTSDLKTLETDEFYYFAKYAYCYSSLQILSYLVEFQNLHKQIVDTGLEVQKLFSSEDYNHAM